MLRGDELLSPTLSEPVDLANKYLRHKFFQVRKYPHQKFELHDVLVVCEEQGK